MYNSVYPSIAFWAPLFTFLRVILKHHLPSFVSWIFYFTALLQTLRQITGWGNTSSPSTSAYRQYHKSIASKSKNRFHHSRVQGNHDAYYNFTSNGGRQTPVPQGPNKNLDSRNVLVNDNARNITHQSHSSTQLVPHTSYNGTNVHTYVLTWPSNAPVYFSAGQLLSLKLKSASVV